MNNIHLHIVGSKTFVSILDELDFNYNISFDKNLKYNNQDLFVRIVVAEKLQLTEIKKYFLENIPTIFLLSNNDYLKKNKLNLMQFHVALFLPIEVLSFREILNDSIRRQTIDFKVILVTQPEYVVFILLKQKMLEDLKKILKHTKNKLEE